MLMGLVAACGAGVAAAASTKFPLPVLEFDFGATVSPDVLPKKEMAPVGVSIVGRVKTRDGSHPQALREIVVDVDRNVEVDFRGLPVCGGKRRGDPRPGVRELRKKCRKAIVGRGKAWLTLSSGNDDPLRAYTTLTAYNLGIGSRTLAIVGGVPGVSTVKLRRSGSGWKAVVQIPKIRGGSGSITAFRLNLRRSFFHRGQRKSFLSARCPDGKFVVMTPKLLFKNEARIPGVAAQTVLKGSLAVPCKPKG